jgi:hypothetical protein
MLFNQKTGAKTKYIAGQPAGNVNKHTRISPEYLRRKIF